MSRLEIKEVNGRFALYKNNCSIGMITITRILYGKSSLKTKEEYVRLMNKFHIKNVIKVASDDKEVLETFLRFLENYIQE